MKNITITMNFTMQDEDATWIMNNLPKYKDRIPNAYFLSKMQQEAIKVGLTLTCDTIGEKASKKKRIQMYLNEYTCPDCGTEWQDEWSATCDDECPKCGAICSPEDSTEL